MLLPAVLSFWEQLENGHLHQISILRITFARQHQWKDQVSLRAVFTSAYVLT